VGSNADQIARFGNEKPVANVQAKTEMASANVRTSPPSGSIVTTLPKGTMVTQISEEDKYVLGVFANPKKAGDNLMGWIVKDAFVAAAVDAGLANTTLNCPTGQSLLLTDTAFCGKVCTTDKDCAARETCTGNAQRINKGKPAENVKTCVLQTFIVDAGAPHLVTVDGGGLVAPAGAEEMAPIAGKCPAFYLMLAADGKCHRICNAAAGGIGGCHTTRCTAKCNVGAPICVSNAALCP
jgi:hypothetical protein